ncbi:lysophospholipid transporter LplT [Pantoea sp. NPDC088449]|uniref:Lysophospholipid transporter LplT n=1 Tax=Candidatus Pantoea floridensis TaxID=1938870 RepID=A0A286BVV4_9GAMM|nr:lysophospholipid transporter LplT [Pantoea floridensis]PIF20742.1 LPLT family lysophospholipid transporter-like MFS transporter [Enterobacteriaceae bacterium JKS000233]SOD38258.1 MFS transporter, LPLT family, lysophospholipid transporter [Pantoea floridensis]HBZ17619.1 lysophospholipid transporter LplT [Pantoea sp.]
MSQPLNRDAPLLSRSMLAVIVAQFFSAFGDNALLFVTLAVLKNQYYPDWSQPILQMLFVATYILLAPFVGQMADSFAKGRVMMFANSLKLLGALIICFGFNPFLGYTLVGIGAASYSPAKYGILTEITHGERLVKANGLMEGSTIAAILLGSVAGGILADWNLVAALVVCAMTYAMAVVANIFIPRLTAARPGQSWHFGAMLRSFVAATKILWRNGETRFSLLGTSLFWGAGVTLRFLLVLWVPVALGISDNKTPTTLNAMVAIGIVIGAAAAAKLVTLQTVRRCMPAGVLIGVMVVVFALQQSLLNAYLILMLIGALGGFFVVPLNALLQERGKDTVGSGNAIAVQNLGENTAMLLMLGLYTVAIKLGAPAVATGVGFGAIFAVAIALLWWKSRR